MSYNHFPRAKVAYGWLPKLIGCLGEIKYTKTFIYDFSNKELIINDPEILEVLKAEKIPFKLIPYTKSLHFIKKIGE